MPIHTPEYQLRQPLRSLHKQHTPVYTPTGRESVFSSRAPAPSLALSDSPPPAVPVLCLYTRIGRANRYLEDHAQWERRASLLLLSLREGGLDEMGWLPRWVKARREGRAVRSDSSRASNVWAHGRRGKDNC